MTKEQAYSIIEAIAEDENTTVEELLNALQQQSAERFKNTVKGLPEESAAYLNAARNERVANRKARAKAEEEKKLDEDVRRFRQIFPDVEAASIPEAVWEDMCGGIPLPYAYALYMAAGAGSKSYAEGVNAINDKAALPPVNGRADDGELTMEDVEAMSRQAVKSNFPRILRSMGKWKI